MANFYFIYDNDHSNGNKVPEQVGEEINIHELVGDKTRNLMGASNKNNENNADVLNQSTHHSSTVSILSLSQPERNQSKHSQLERNQSERSQLERNQPERSQLEHSQPECSQFKRSQSEHSQPECNQLECNHLKLK